MLGFSWWNRVTHLDVPKRNQSASIESNLSRQQPQWVGHVTRMPDERLPKQVLSCMENLARAFVWLIEEKASRIIWKEPSRNASTTLHHWRQLPWNNWASEASVIEASKNWRKTGKLRWSEGETEYLERSTTLCPKMKPANVKYVDVEAAQASQHTSAGRVEDRKSSSETMDFHKHKLTSSWDLKVW